MSNFNQNNFNDFIVNNNIVGFFEKPITLKSGRISNWYANWRNVVEDVYLTEQLADFIIEFAKENNFNPDCFYGVPEGATKTGIIAQYKWAKQQSNYGQNTHVLPMGRKVPKGHGEAKDRFFVGAPKGKVVVIEDVTTTGGSLIENLTNLKEMGIEIQCALALFNRMEKRDDEKSVQEKVNEMGIEYIAMSKATEILPKVIKKTNPSEGIVQELKKYFEQYGIEKLEV